MICVKVRFDQVPIREGQLDDVVENSPLFMYRSSPFLDVDLRQRFDGVLGAIPSAGGPKQDLEEDLHYPRDTMPEEYHIRR